MALITSRMSVVRGCPPGLAGGMSGERMAHSFSVRSTSVTESFHCSTSSIFPLVLLLHYITLHTASEMPGSIENPMQLFRGTQFAGLLTKHFRRTEAIVIAFPMSPMRLGIVIGHKALMGQLRSLPTRHLLAPAPDSCASSR